MARYSYVLTLALLLSLQSLFAQPKSTRDEDRFYGRRVVMRMDLNEKFNRPLVSHTALTGNTPSPGLISALMQGLEAGAYAAYDPESLSEPLSYEDVISRMELMVNGDQSHDNFDQGMQQDDMGLGMGPDSTYAPAMGGGGMFDPTNPSFADFEQTVQVVEDWIFDKNRGEMIYRPLFIQVIWSDPMETLPERYVAVFRYSDVEDALDEFSYPNRFNDAEQRTLKEVFELRLYHAFVTEISGYGVYSLEESKTRQEALVEFEHHLWSY